ncbi:uncharacterized protein LOC129732305 [Wyeomyia smithii]|uniref:uncharacterized protein LOC129732305 n=1 Tax=Wyeomyia smithii TaxID=174621 RepID=UPI002467B8D6|nr:uncharacterized protein LOC129732305 [Wyeomyia smithii]
MYHKENRQLFNQHKIALPPKVCQTRWNVWYILMKYLKSLEGTPFLALLQNKDPYIDFSCQWNFIRKFCEAFEPVFVLTLKTQKNHVPLTDFYAEWLVCQAQLNGCSEENILARKLLAAMESRMKTLRNSMPFKVCIYMDPRFNFFGSNRLGNNEKSEVQQYLLALNAKLNDIAGLNTEICEENADTTRASSDDFVEQYLTHLFHEDTVTTQHGFISSDPFLKEIIKLESRTKVPIVSPQEPGLTPSGRSQVNFDIMQYWKQRKFANPNIYRLAIALLSVPSTQVTVERLFSQLKLVLTDSRTCLSDKMISDIMLLKMNSSLWPRIIDIIEAEIDEKNNF